MNQKLLYAIIGTGIGAVGGYFFAKYQFEKKHEEYIHEKVNEGIEAYILASQESTQDDTSSDPVEVYSSEQVETHDVDYASFYRKPSPKELIKMTNDAIAEAEHPMDSDEDTEFETMEEQDERLDAEIQGDKKMHKEPFEITIDEYAAESHYDKETLYWYDTDSTLSTESGEVIENPMDIAGDLLNVFDNPEREAVIVRNPKRGTDYEIIQLHEAYADQFDSEPDWGD